MNMKRELVMAASASLILLSCVLMGCQPEIRADDQAIVAVPNLEEIDITELHAGYLDRRFTVSQVVARYLALIDFFMWLTTRG